MRESKPVIQNVPGRKSVAARAVREAFLKAHPIVSADYAEVEARVLAQQEEEARRERE